jgi:hypothetical protein
VGIQIPIAKIMASQNSGKLITSPQTITADWTNVGCCINTTGYSFFSSIIDLDINDSENVQFRYRAQHDDDLGTIQNIILPMKTLKKDKILLDDVYYEINDDIDQSIIIETGIDQVIHNLTLQVRALTVGATPAVINTALYHQGYRQ